MKFHEGSTSAQHAQTSYRSAESLPDHLDPSTLHEYHQAFYQQYADEELPHEERQLGLLDIHANTSTRQSLRTQSMAGNSENLVPAIAEQPERAAVVEHAEQATTAESSEPIATQHIAQVSMAPSHHSSALTSLSLRI